MRRFIAVALTLLMLIPFCLIANAETYVPSRTINLVYDDSGSMIRVGSNYVDTWCQAKYAMEFFAGMLGENETLNIYYMSDYVNGSTSAPPSQIKPKSDKTPVITPHIDRNWHIISAIPDLDDKNQAAQERKIYKAFMLGLVFDMIRYSKVSEGKYLYRLEIKGCKAEDFVVSNQTPCDNFYEVLDALTINPVIVNCIIDAANRIFEKEINGSSKVTFATSKLMSRLDTMASREFNKDGLTLFDMATLLKVSTPSANFDKNIGTDIMKVMLDVVYDYMKSMTLANDLDLGLIVSVERNLKRYLEIIADVLNWHSKKMLETPPVPEEPEEEFVPDFGNNPKPKRKGLLGVFDKVEDFFKKIFGKKKKEEPKTEGVDSNPEEITATTEPIDETDVTPGVEPENVANDSVDNAVESSEETDEESVALKDSVIEPEPQIEVEDENSVATDDIGGEDEELAGEVSTEQTIYQKKCFVKFGFENIDAVLDIDGTSELLKELGCDNNPLQQVREISNSEDGIPSDYDPHKYGAHLCDFCGVELLGGEYELLKDGRERCNRCSMTAIKKVEDFKALYKTVVPALP